MGIKTSAELQQSLEASLRGDKDAIWDIAIYKLYNFYIQTHIKHGTEEDQKNEEIFKKIEKDHPELHTEIESIIDYKIKSWEADD